MSWWSLWFCITEKWIITRRPSTLGERCNEGCWASFFPFIPQEEGILFLLSSLKKIGLLGRDHFDFDNLELLSARFWTTNFCPSSNYFSALQVHKYLEKESLGTAQTTQDVFMLPESLRPRLAASLPHLPLFTEPMRDHFVQCLQVFKWESWLGSHLPV